MKNRPYLIIRVLISFSLIGLLLWLMREQLPSIAVTIRDANIGFLLVGFFLLLTAVAITGFRLLKVISAQGIRLSPKEAIYLTFIGYFFNNFLPTSIGGDLVKAYYAGKRSNRKGAAFAGIFMDRFLAVIPFTLIPAITLVFCHHKIENKGLIAVVYILLIGCLTLFWLLLNKDKARYLAFILEPFKGGIWYERIKNGYGFLNIYSHHKLILLWSFTLSFSTQVLAIMSVFFFSRSLGIDYLSAWVFFVVCPIIGIMTLLPSLNGLGIREGGFVYLLKAYMPPEKAFAISLLYLAALISFGIIGGLIYATKKSLFSFREL